MISKCIFYRINTDDTVQTFSKSSPTKSQIVVETVTQPDEASKIHDLNTLYVRKMCIGISIINFWQIVAKKEKKLIKL